MIHIVTRSKNNSGSENIKCKAFKAEACLACLWISKEDSEWTQQSNQGLEL